MSETPLLTRAEASKYTETSRHAEVVAFLKQLATESHLVHLTSLGLSGEGQDIVAAVVSDGVAFTPELARSQGKLIVMIEANIHAGEVEGKEAVLAMARDLTRTKAGKKLLARLCIVIIPDFNPDGNDRISPKNRALNLAALEGQVNPEGGVGTRYTGQGWNLNRDNMKQEAPETRALAAFYQAWWPHLFIDCHTTDGSLHGFDLTFDTSRNNTALFREVNGAARQMLERVSRKIEKKHGFKSQFYGNFPNEDDPTSGWMTYPPLPRFGSHYRGLLGRFDVLLETYSYLPYERRVQVASAWLWELCRYAAKRRESLIEACEVETARISRRGRQGDPRPHVAIQHGVAQRSADGTLSFRYPPESLGEEVRVVSFDPESVKARVYPGKELRAYKVPHLRHTIPQTKVTTPAAYLINAPLAEHLQRHGIAFERLDAAWTGEVESYAVLAMEKTFSPDVAGVVPPPGEGEVPLSARPPPLRFETVLSVRPERREATFPKGTLVVRTAQRAGTLAVYLLEPHSDDGLARWEFLDAHVQVGAPFPIHRVPHGAGLPPRATVE
jgi:hypothetical protein